MRLCEMKTLNWLDRFLANVALSMVSDARVCQLVLLSCPSTYCLRFILVFLNHFLLRSFRYFIRILNWIELKLFESKSDWIEGHWIWKFDNATCWIVNRMFWSNKIDYYRRHGIPMDLTWEQESKATLWIYCILSPQNRQL